MEIKEKYPEQVDPAERASGSGRGTRGPLDRLALIAFSGFAIMYFAGIVAGMIILSLVATIVPQTNAVNTSTNGQAVVHLAVDTFTPNAVVVPKGERLLIVDV